MKAIVQDTYGGPEVLRLAEIDRPRPGPGQVLVRVRAAGVDRGVWHLMTGLPYLVRVMGYGFRRPKSPVPGQDLAGIVEEVGQDVTRFRPGDEVFGLGRGAFAEYACAPEDKLVPKPENLFFEQAAAVPVSGLTAVQAVRDEAQVQAGQTVAVLGAGGGVGTYAVQIAKALGAEVTGVASTAKAELVRSIGADHFIDYTQEDVAAGGRRYDVILDLAGNRPLKQLRRALAPRGTLVIIGGEMGGRWLGGMSRSVGASLLSSFVRQTLRAQLTKENRENLVYLAELVESGGVVPVLDRTFPLAEAPDAVRYLEQNRARGKVVVTMAAE